MENESGEQGQNQWSYGFEDRVLTEVVGNSVDCPELVAVGRGETQDGFTNNKPNSMTENIWPQFTNDDENLCTGFDDLLFSSLSGLVDESPTIVSNHNQGRNTLQQINPSDREPVEHLGRNHIRPNFPILSGGIIPYYATTIGNYIYKLEFNESGHCSLTQIGTSPNQDMPDQKKHLEAPRKTKRPSWFSDENFARLDNSDILRVAGNKLREIYLKENVDVKKQIIRSIGKIVFDILFDDHEILAGSVSGRSTKAKAEAPKKYDSDKVSLCAAFVATVLLQAENWQLSMEELKKCLQDFAKKNTTGLSKTDWKYFKQNILSRHACTRREKLSGRGKNLLKER